MTAEIVARKKEAREALEEHRAQKKLREEKLEQLHRENKMVVREQQEVIKERVGGRLAKLRQAHQSILARKSEAKVLKADQSEILVRRITR